MEEAITADRVIVMNDGVIIMDDTPKNIFSRVDKLKEIGLDVPQTTELAYLLQKSGINVPSGIMTIKDAADVLENLILKGEKN